MEVMPSLVLLWYDWVQRLVALTGVDMQFCLSMIDCMTDTVELGLVRTRGSRVAGQHRRYDLLVHGGYDGDADGQLGSLDLSGQNWEYPQSRLDGLRNSCGEIVRGLILSGHAMGSRAGIHPSGWHVLRDCNPPFLRST